MISFVRGKVADIAGDSLVIDLGGVGLEVYAPFSMLQPTPVIVKIFCSIPICRCARIAGNYMALLIKTS